MHIIGQIGLYLTNNLRSARMRAPIHVGPQQRLARVAQVAVVIERQRIHPLELVD